MIDNLFREYKSLIEERIEVLFPNTNANHSKVVEALKYSLALGGKRIRPIIMMEFCKLFGGKQEEVLDFAIALEMIHTYSLIHDDLPCMDNDDMRRGKPSCHIAFGEDMALLAGDALLTEAFSLIAKTNLTAEVKVKAISVLADMSGIYGMLGGQVIDLSFVGKTPDIDSLFEMYNKKTGCLLRAAAVIGSLVANASQEDIEKADIYARKTGLAFQIIDDILDTVGDEATLGKPIGSDKKNQKTTSVTILGLQNAKILAEKLTNESLEILNEFENSNALKDITNFLLEREL